jgi:putative membrane protein
MKKYSSLKVALLLVTFVTTILVSGSCGFNEKPKDTKDVAEERNEAKFDSNKQEKDAQFLVNAAEVNLEQIQLAKLAQQIGRTAHVKELGKMMEASYTKSQNQLMMLAKSKNINIPTSPTENAKDSYNRLNEKSGDDFDKAYADMVVNIHKDAIEIFEKATTEGTDSEIKNWAIATLPDMRTHLNHSIDCQKKCEEMK